MKFSPTHRPRRGPAFTSPLALATAVLLGALTHTAHADSAEQPAKPVRPDAAFDRLITTARTAAAAPYTGPAAGEARAPLPAGLSDLKYDGHRDIRCPPGKFLWAGTDLPFRVQYKHLGWLFPDTVELKEVVVNAPLQASVDHATAIAPIPFDPSHFTYGQVARQTLDPGQLPHDLGYAGLSLHHVALTEGGGSKQAAAAGEFYNEILSIQGGSYFRAVGTGQHWGASVRAAAIDTAIDGLPEEFPRWTQLWAQQPQPGATTVTLYGLMEGPSLAGAYRLTVTPGPTLRIDVDAQLFMRHGVTKLGLAPITSMFLFGEGHLARFGDYRPEVHDSDGLGIVYADGRQTWRPLHNPFGLSVTRFNAENPRGFGLLQRDRNFDSYQDLETEMQLRPSIWVTPKGNWGKGHIELVEFGSKLEATDNIGAFWVPHSDQGFNQPGGHHAYGYTVEFTQAPRPIEQEPRPNHRIGFEPQQHADQGLVVTAPAPLVRFTAVRTAPARAHGDEVGTGGPASPVRFIVDTAPGHTLPNGTPVLAKAAVQNGQLMAKPFTQYNRFDDAYRVFFDVLPDGPGPIDITLTLKGEDRDAETGEPVPDPTFNPNAPPQPHGAAAPRPGIIDGPALSETLHYRWERP